MDKAIRIPSFDTGAHRNLVCQTNQMFVSLPKIYSSCPISSDVSPNRYDNSGCFFTLNIEAFFERSTSHRFPSAFFMSMSSTTNHTLFHPNGINLKTKWIDVSEHWYEHKCFYDKNQKTLNVFISNKLIANSSWSHLLCCWSHLLCR